MKALMFLYVKQISFVYLTVLAAVTLLLNNYITHDPITFPHRIHAYNQPSNGIVGTERDSLEIKNAACIISNVDKFDFNSSMFQLQNLISTQPAAAKTVQRSLVRGQKRMNLKK